MFLSDWLLEETALREYALLGGHYMVQGWLDPGAIAATLILAGAQRQLGPPGPAVEIGIHHGRYFILLALLGDGGLAIDLFEDQHLNVDQSGLGDRRQFETNLNQRGPADGTIRIEKMDSLEASPDQLLESLHQRRATLFSIDGGHTARHAENDLRLASAICAETGLIIVDDFENPSWPGVQQGVRRFFEGGGHDWVPLTAQNNKLFIVHASHRRFFAEALSQATPIHKAPQSEIEIFGFPTIDRYFSDPRDALTDAGRLAVSDLENNPSARFTKTQSDAVRLGSGWSLVEADGVWSQASAADLQILQKNASPEATIVFRVHAFCSQNTPPLNVSVVCDGQKIGEWVFTNSASSDKILHLPSSAGSPPMWRTLSFKIAKPRSPASLGLSEDERTLGIKLKSYQWAE